MENKFACAGAPAGSADVLWQLFLNGPTNDGNIISKQARDYLHDAGLIQRGYGLNWLTQEGVINCVAAGYVPRKDKLHG